jgi:hypothetical protein
VKGAHAPYALFARFVYICDITNGHGAAMPKARARPQSEKFVEKARELGCNEDEAAFDERLRKIAKATPPQPGKKKQGKRKSG